jgi:hypothetical protein
MNDVPEIAEHLRALAQNYHDTHLALEKRYGETTSAEAFLAELRQREALLVDRFRRVQHQLIASVKEEDLEKILDFCRIFDEVRVINQFTIQTLLDTVKTEDRSEKD